MAANCYRELLIIYADIAKAHGANEFLFVMIEIFNLNFINIHLLALHYLHLHRDSVKFFLWFYLFKYIEQTFLVFFFAKQGSKLFNTSLIPKSRSL